MKTRTLLALFLLPVLQFCGCANSNSEGTSSPCGPANRLRVQNVCNAEKITIVDLNLTLVSIAPGEFMMGSLTTEDDRYDNERQHKVTITRPYWLGATEVTQAQYEAVMGNNPSYFKGADHPVERVRWEDAVEFCRKLTVREREAGRLPDDQVYRLPTEAEWEYACRAGATTAFHYGNSLSILQANFDGNHPYGGEAAGSALDRTTGVASYMPNAWGFYDMHGNVLEWCSDWYGDYPFDAATDPTGAEQGSFRVFRGGGWSRDARRCRSAYRFRFTPTWRYNSLGFRLARGAP